jgi:thiol-disulfide isomerase/thioredoxin
VITSAREIVIALLLELPLGTAALAPLKQDGLWRRNTLRNGQIFPHVEIPAVGGGVLNLPQDLAGSFGVVIIYRGHWCPFCNEQMAAFASASETLAKEGIKVVAFSVDDEATTKEFIAKSLFEKWNLRGIPSCLRI